MRSALRLAPVLLPLILGGCHYISETVTVIGSTVSEQASSLGTAVMSPFRRSQAPVTPATPAEIMEAKLLLRALHYEVGPGDETLDPKTRAAIQAFETVKWASGDMSQPITDEPPPKPSGDVTPDLVGRLDRAVASVESLTAALSKIGLVALGFDADCQTRQIDARTIAAIESFERQENLPIDGMVSDRLYESVKLKKRSLSHPVASTKHCTVISGV
jgi:peptidoglycan hydrolase-like protein with peptidoglycan-binding domain